jgi:hypothetical protein
MHLKVKVLIARWLAKRINARARRLHRALRDHQRAELGRIRAADRRARGLRLYAAWSCKQKEPINYSSRTIAAVIGCWEAGQQDSCIRLAAAKKKMMEGLAKLEISAE